MPLAGAGLPRLRGVQGLVEADAEVLLINGDELRRVALRDPKTWLQKMKRWAKSIKRDIVALWIAARDARVPWHAKLVAGCVAAYALSPIDLIPDFIPGGGARGASDKSDSRRSGCRGLACCRGLVCMGILAASPIDALGASAIARPFQPSSRIALAVTSTVAPVSARIAGHRPVMPMMVVTRNTAFSPSAMVMFCRMLRHGRLRQVDHVGDVGDAAVQHGGVGGFQRHVGAAAHGDADIGRGQRRGVVDAVADLGDDLALRLQFADDALLVFGQQLGADLDAELLCRWPRRCARCRRSA